MKGLVLPLLLPLSVLATVPCPPDSAHAPETRRHQGIASVAVSKVNGRLWCTYYCDPLGGENHLNYCVLATSADKGRTWKEVLIADPDGEGLKRAFDPEVWIAPDGRLRWTWTERTLDPEKTNLADTENGHTGFTTDRLFVVELDAENEPRGPQEPARDVLPGIMMCKPTVVKSGDWVFPLCEWNAEPSTRFYATRDGRTFRLVGGVTLPKDWRQFDEEQMVELSDGRWRTLLRTCSGLAESFSSDGGRTWSAPVESKLGHPNARLFIGKLPSGNLLLVKHGRIGERPEGGKWKVRKDLRAFVSTDDGRTWKGGLLIDGRTGVSYPDADIGPDGTIYVAYDYARTKEKAVLISRFTEAEVLASTTDTKAADPLSVAGTPFDRQDETSLAGEPWTLAVESTEPVVRHGADALREFLARRFAVDTTATGGVRRIVLAVAPEKDPLTSRLTVTENEIRITGATPREVLQGCYRLEDELKLAARPAVKRGSRTYTRMFSPRMVHSGRAIDDYPDGHLDEIARAGMDAILVYVRDPPNVTRAGPVDLAALVKRAAERGLDVYAYFDRWNRHLEKHPLDPGAEDYYDGMFGSIVKNAPGLKGLICVGESCGFPRQNGKDAGFNTFAPVPDWAPWLELVSKVTRRYNPDFDIVFWTYSWPRAPEKDRLALLEAIPTNCSVLVTFELGEKPQQRHGVLLSVEDYSISIPGPSPAFMSEAPTVRRRGMRLATMSNTGGRTWDFGGAPYEPVPFCWLERFRALRAAQRTYGLSALMDSHHYGFAPNLCADIAKLAFTREVTDAQLESCIGEEVERQFGAAAAPAVLAALRDWSAAMDWHSASSLDQWGVLRVGPTYPFVPMGAKLPPPPSCLGKGKKWKFVDPVAGQVWGYGYAPGDLPPHIELSKGELALWKSGTDRLAGVPGEAARRLLGLGKFCECSIRTRYNLHRYWKAVADGRPAAEVRKILDEEAANVRELLPFVEADARLGWEPEMGTVADSACLRWKLGQLETMKKELGK